MSSLEAKADIFIDTNIVLVYTYYIDKTQKTQFSLNIYPTTEERNGNDIG
jgi:hypothetical protein